MAWMTVSDRRGRGWEVDLDRVSQVLYSEAFSHQKRVRARRVVEHHGIYPDQEYIAFNWNGMREQVRLKAEQAFRSFMNALFRDGEIASRSITNARLRAIRDETHVWRMQRAAGRDSYRNIQTGVRLAAGGAATARVIRNLSASALIIGSTMVSGGTSLGLLTLGSQLQGLGTYQDTGNVGAAVIGTSTSFVFGLVPLGATSLVGRTAGQLSRAETRALFYVGIQGDILSSTAVSLAQGEDARTAIVGAAVNAGLGAVVGEVGDSFFNALAVPTRALVQSAVGSGVGVASSAITEQIVSSQQRTISNARGRLSPVGAVTSSLQNSRQFNESFVQLFVMRPVLSGAQPPARNEFLAALRSVNS